ncbi:MAG TPA: type II toxin-antitoxin system RelE/ParE family toxin [Candidatus Avalokitesvara rifleensis]|uniref:type II toxin-antitoxin system RelE/ParE family toxin n=1 Tax=Candidatus Avalokitesvara rifleensis TaxID=3367620 RepID=UPI004025C9DB
MEIGVSSSFRRAFKKRIGIAKELERLFWRRMEVFSNNPHEPSLKTHKLSGELEGLWSFSINYDIRVIFKFIDKNKVLLIDIGSHDEVY